MQYLHDLKPDEILAVLSNGKVVILKERMALCGVAILSCVVGQNVSDAYFASTISVRLLPSSSVTHLKLPD